jgi:hypothetical protein
MATESGRHTDPATGKSYRTFAVSKPDAPRAGYLNEADLTARFQPVTPEAASQWWTLTHAAIPPIQTTETHIIGGAIIPLWQRFKTSEGGRLRVVRVTTDEGQRIVGIRIPRERVARVLYSLGISRSLREPGEIFNAVLDEGEEISLTANLTLKLGSIHGEPAIELCGADPYKFDELRELGFINEQINWKQRFFVPTDEDKGIAILADLLTRYPITRDYDTQQEADADHALPEADNAYNGALKVVDIEQWIIEVIQSHNEHPGETPESPSPTPEIEAMAETTMVQQEETPTEPQQAISQHPFELTACPVPLPRPPQTRKTSRIIEEQMAFDFSAV